MKYKRYIPYFSAVLCTAVYLSLVFNDNIWLDEAFSASIIRCGYKEMLSRTFADTLPPFYNLSAWLFTHIFGFSTIGLKIFSVLPVFLLMLVSAHFLTRVSSVRASCIYMALITGMPHFLEHGVEIRMYSWAVFFASSAAIFALCVTRKIRYAGIGLTACTVLGAYTHQYALIAEVFIWLMLLIVMYRNKEISAWLKMSAVCIILYIPCAVLTLHQMKAASSYFSAAPATLGSLFCVNKISLCDKYHCTVGDTNAVSSFIANILLQNRRCIIGILYAHLCFCYIYVIWHNVVDRLHLFHIQVSDALNRDPLARSICIPGKGDHGKKKGRDICTADPFCRLCRCICPAIQNGICGYVRI